MELRRALLLFAIVLGVAAVVAAVAGPTSRRSERTTATPPPATAPGRGVPPAPVRVDGRGSAAKRVIDIGRATTLVVAVDEAGQVELAGLGLIDAAEPTDPAVFDLFPARSGRYRVLFIPAGGVRARALGELVSRPATR